MSTKYETIRYLGHCYFHQDWQDDSATPTEVVSLFAQRNPQKFSKQLLEELHDAGQPSLDESAAKRIWVDLADAMYDPTLDNLSYREWVLTVINTVEQFLESHQTIGHS